MGGSGPGDQVPFGPELLVDLSFMPTNVQQRLEKMKKKDSHVKGDPLPHLVRQMPDQSAGPISVIFNRAAGTCSWPDNWKTEYITVIPKVKNPALLSETRNISCTALFSKILEGALLEKLRDKFVPDPTQYGAVKRCCPYLWLCSCSVIFSLQSSLVLSGGQGRGGPLGVQ